MADDNSGQLNPPAAAGAEVVGEQGDSNTVMVTKKTVETPIKSEASSWSHASSTLKDSARKKALSFLEISNKKVVYCGIPSCGVKSDRLTTASSNVLTYYGYKDRLAVVKVCANCREKAEQFEKDCVEAVRSGDAIFTIKHEPVSNMPEMVDLDDDESSGPSDPAASRDNGEEVEVDFDRGDVEALVKSITSKFNVRLQVEKCTKLCTEEANKLEKEMNELDEMMNSVDNVLYETCKRYNSVFDKRPQPVVIQEMEINADGSIRRRNVGSDKVFVNSESLKKLASIINKSPDKAEEEGTATSPRENASEGDVLNQSSTSPSDPATRKPGPASKTGYYEALDAQRSGPFERQVERPPELLQKKVKKLLPTPKIIPRVRPKVGDIIYGNYRSMLHFWLQAEVLEVVHNEATDQDEFVVHFEPTIRKTGKPTGGQEGEGTIRLLRQLNLKQMAFNVPCPFHLPVGSRVIAKFKDELSSDPDVDGLYYAGVVAEPSKTVSKDRYLIFFDDGYAQYVFPDDVLLVCESSKLVWNDVYPDSYDFVKDYVTRWPNWPMVKLHVGSMVATEWNGKWLVARILQVDNCLARIRFQNDSREEWIYRGSTRFRPVYRIFEKEADMKAQQQETSSKENKIPRHDPEEFKNRSAPTVEYKCSDDSAVALYQKGARKSTGRLQLYDELRIFTGGGLSSNFINMLDPDLCIEFQGSLAKIKVPLDAPKSKKLVPHTCSPSCVIPFVPSKELKRASPLAIPFFFGWDRDVSKGSSRHVVFYRAPCGVRLRDCDELAKFLDTTNSNLSVDHFCFEYSVDCLNEFIPARALVNVKDISYGKEGAPVQCINSVDYDVLPYMEYTPGRIVGPDVNMNTDDDFLVCCDCTDNCQDKSKCACWKLTQEGIAFTKLNDETNPTVGYEHRRLKDHVVSGIFECNSRCKCKQTCSNRVVQNGVQWPLQIFKTTKKGWGIRAVYDMPEGTFICIYAGQILNDQTANQDGIEFGDEYLAELDYIECNEQVKEDYESDVTDIEAAGESDSDEDAKTPEKQRLVKPPRREEDMDDDEPEADEEDSEPEKDSHADDTNFTSKAKINEASKRKFATRRTTGQKKNLDHQMHDIVNNDDDMITARAAHFNPKVTTSRRKRRRIQTRDLYGHNEQCYIMDAKSKGNIGRYLNHSCHPNVFVQNVFVDTHDMRFPMVAFFTNTHVRAGSELTWDYHYQIGSVPDKVLYCFCMTPYCRGRLL